MTLALLRRALVILAALTFFFSPARADEESDVRTVIESQLNAFAADQDDAAYSHAAPVVKMAFPTVDQFMRMVKGGYKMVYRNTSREFQKLEKDGLGRPSMRVLLTAEDGKRYEAFYAMEKQPDGTWKIAGCVVLELPAQEV
jgi:ketosteroid isomerase-like protein